MSDYSGTPYVLFKHLERYRYVLILQSWRSEGSDVAKVLFNHFEGHRSVNFPELPSLRTQVRLRFSLST